MCEQPPRKKSPPLELPGLRASWVKITFAVKPVPPFVDSYNPTFATPGGVKRPPFTDDEPCRATAVPMKMCVASFGSMAIAAIERPVATGQLLALLCAQGAFVAVLPETSDHELPPLVDLYRPTPASESLEPFGSPVPR